MSTTSYFRKSEIHSNGTEKYGTTLKYLVQTLVSLDPMLTIYSVAVDTDKMYDAYIRVFDSNEGFRIRNDSSYKDNISMYTGYWNQDGTWVAQESWVSRGYPLQSAGQCCCFSWGIGGCLRYFGISSSYGSSFIGGFYGRFSYSGSDNTVYPRMVISLSNQSFPSAPIIVTYSTIYVYNPSADSGEAIGFSSFTASSSAYTKSGYDSALMPLFYQGYTTNRGFLNIKWDNAHKLYALYEGTTEVLASPGRTVTVDGTSIMSVGKVIYAK